MTGPPRITRGVLIAAAVFTGAMVLRLLYMKDLVGLPYFDHPIMDADYHDTWAREIAGGRLSRGEPFFRAPLYPYFLALVYKVTSGSYVVPRIIQFVLGSLTSVMCYVLGRRLFGTAAGAIAGFLCALYPILIYFEGELLTETLFIFLCMLGLLLLYTAAAGGRRRTWFAAGLALGAALVTRPTVGLFVPLAVIGALIVARRRLPATLLVVLGLVIPLIPVTAHNYAVSGEFIPVVWQGGLNLYLGNNPAADGWSATAPDLRKDWWGGYKDMIAIPREALGHEPGYGEVSDYWTAKALDFMESRPGRWLRLMGRKILLFWSSMELPNNQDFNFARLQSAVLANPLIGFGTVAPLALVGLVLSFRRWKKFFFLDAYLLAFFAGTVAFFVCSRYRAPAVPALCILAAGALAAGVSMIRGRRYRALALTGVLLIGAALLVNLRLTDVRPPDLAQSYTQTGKVYVEIGDTGRAAASFRRAIEANPEWGEAYEELGLLKMREGRADEAERLLKQAVGAVPDLATAHRSLAMLYLSQGDTASARASALTAMRYAPYLEDTHNVLGSVERAAGRTDEALRLFRREMEINPENWRALANLASLYQETGDLEKAAEYYEHALAVNPEDSDLIFSLASVYSRLGMDERSSRLLDRLGERLPQDLTLRYNRAVMLQDAGQTEEAAEIYRDVLEADPRHEGTLVNLGVIYAREGRYDEALRLWERALEVNPSNQTVHRNIRLLEERRQE
jgi:tetratricopeptide (TPR) repeat protein